MKKDAYYFPHFSNARSDAKILKIRRIFGIEGYGIFFMLLEILREQTDFRLPISSIEDIAFELHISREKIISIVYDFDLFEIHENKFFSPKLIFYLQPYIEKSNRARSAALVRWNNANEDAKALQMQCDSNASKVKEIKEKENIITSVFSFEDFWNMYDKKIDSKKCKKKYAKLSEDVRLKIKETLPIYLSTIADKQFQKHPATYLNNECWNDEIIKPSKPIIKIYATEEDKKY